MKRKKIKIIETTTCQKGSVTEFEYGPRPHDRLRLHHVLVIVLTQEKEFVRRGQKKKKKKNLIRFCVCFVSGPRRLVCHLFYFFILLMESQTGPDGSIEYPASLAVQLKSILILAVDCI